MFSAMLSHTGAWGKRKKVCTYIYYYCYFSWLLSLLLAPYILHLRPVPHLPHPNFCPNPKGLTCTLFLLYTLFLGNSPPRLLIIYVYPDDSKIIYLHPRPFTNLQLLQWSTGTRISNNPRVSVVFTLNLCYKQVNIHIKSTPKSYVFYLLNKFKLILPPGLHHLSSNFLNPVPETLPPIFSLNPSSTLKARLIHLKANMINSQRSLKFLNGSSFERVLLLFIGISAFFKTTWELLGKACVTWIPMWQVAQIINVKQTSDWDCEAHARKKYLSKPIYHLVIFIVYKENKSMIFFYFLIQKTSTKRALW